MRYLLLCFCVLGCAGTPTQNNTRAQEPRPQPSVEPSAAESDPETEANEFEFALVQGRTLAGAAASDDDPVSTQTEGVTVTLTRGATPLALETVATECGGAGCLASIRFRRSDVSPVVEDPDGALSAADVASLRESAPEGTLAGFAFVRVADRAFVQLQYYYLVDRDGTRVVIRVWDGESTVLQEL